MVSAAQDAPATDAAAHDDEAFSRLILRGDLPRLGLTLDELLRRASLEKAAA